MDKSVPEFVPKSLKKMTRRLGGRKGQEESRSEIPVAWSGRPFWRESGEILRARGPLHQENPFPISFVSSWMLFWCTSFWGHTENVAVVKQSVEHRASCRSIAEQF